MKKVKIQYQILRIACLFQITLISSIAIAADTPTLAVAYDAISITDSECNKNAEIVLSEMGFKIKRSKSNVLWALKEPYKAFVLCNYKEKMVFIVIVGPKGHDDICKRKANFVLKNIKN